MPNDCLWYDKLLGPSQRVVTLFVHMESSKSSHLTNFAGIVLAIRLGFCRGDGDRPIDEVSHQIAFRLPPVFLTISI